MNTNIPTFTLLKFYIALMIAAVAAYGLVSAVDTRNYMPELETISEVKTDKEVEMSPATQKHLECLARNVYHEAKSEHFSGQIAVAQVTINRAKSGKFPSDICAVVEQRTISNGRWICQFSWMCSAKSVKLNKDQYRSALAAAREVLINGTRIPQLSNAMFFHSRYLNTAWTNRVHVATIGNHVFYQ